MINLLLLIVGLAMLVKCADWFVDGCSNVAKALGVPTLIIGLTIVSFGTSAPEVAVSVTASIQGMNDIALGNVVGSNICNLLLVLGMSGLFGCLTAERKIITRDFLYMIFSGIVLFILSFGFFLEGKTEGVISQTNGLILLCFLVIYLYALIGEALISSRTKEEKTKFKFRDILFIIVGLVGIIAGGQLVVDSAVEIANMFNISQNIIALTIVAIGTSLPELVTSVMAAKKGEVDIAIGNVVGSNIFNVFFILGLSSAISPITFGIDSFYDIIFMMISSAIVYLLLLKNRCIDKKQSIIMLGMYAIYMVYILVR